MLAINDWAGPSRDLPTNPPSRTLSSNSSATDGDFPDRWFQRHGFGFSGVLMGSFFVIRLNVPKAAKNLAAFFMKLTFCLKKA
jgi:hypothetical protein